MLTTLRIGCSAAILIVIRCLEVAAVGIFVSCVNDVSVVAARSGCSDAHVLRALDTRCGMSLQYASLALCAWWAALLLAWALLDACFHMKMLLCGCALCVASLLLSHARIGWECVAPGHAEPWPAVLAAGAVTFLAEALAIGGSVLMIASHRIRIRGAFEALALQTHADAASRQSGKLLGAHGADN